MRMAPGEVVSVGGRHFEMIRVNHSIPAVGYRVAGDQGVFAFSGDTTTNDTFWEALNRQERLDLLIVEVAFSEAQHRLAGMAHHYCPSLLAADLAKLRHHPQTYLPHLKPGDEAAIVAECQKAVSDRTLKPLVGGETFQL